MTEAKIEYPNRLLLPLEAAQLLGCKPHTLAVWRIQGKGPRYVKLGGGKAGRIAYAPADLMAFIEQSRKSSTSQNDAHSAGR